MTKTLFQSLPQHLRPCLGYAYIMAAPIFRRDIHGKPPTLHQRVDELAGSGYGNAQGMCELGYRYTFALTNGAQYKGLKPRRRIHHAFGAPFEKKRKGLLLNRNEAANRFIYVNQFVG